MKATTALGFLALAISFARSAAALETTIDDFEGAAAPAPWTFSNGPEFPGASGSLTAGAGHSGKGAQLAFDFTGGGAYVSASRSFETPIAAAAVGLWVRADPGIHLALRVTDSTGQTLQYQAPRPLEAFDASVWYRGVVPVGASTSHWGGADDGVPHLPLQSISVLAADPLEPGLTGAIDFDDVFVIDALDPLRIDPASNDLAPPPPGSSELASRLGVNIHFTQDDQALDIARDAGFSWVRMDLGWSGFEQTQGSYDFTKLDGLVAALSSRNLRLHLILDYMNPLYPGAGTSEFMTITVPAFAAMTQATTAHFAGKGVTYEVWNEPNLDGFWPPQADALEYAALSKAAIAGAHAGDASAKVSTAGISGFDITYLRDYLQAGGGENADAIGVHPYRLGGGESALEDLIFMRSVVAQTLPALPPIWDTEWGYSSTWYGGDGHTAEARATQAELTARELLCVWAIGFPLAIYYDIRDDGSDPTDKEHNFGLIQNDYQDKPAIVAVRTLSKIASGRTFVGFLRLGLPAVHALRLDGASDTVVALWSSASDVELPIRVASTTTGVDSMGAALAMSPDGDSLGFSIRESDGPVYLTFPKAPPVDGGTSGAAGTGGGATDAGLDAATGGGSNTGGSAGSASKRGSDDSSGCGCRLETRSSSALPVACLCALALAIARGIRRRQAHGTWQC